MSTTFDVVVGAISTTQFLGNAEFYLDKTVLSEDVIDISSGSPNAGIHFKTTDLVGSIKPIICDIICNCEEESSGV